LGVGCVIVGHISEQFVAQGVLGHLHRVVCREKDIIVVVAHRLDVEVLIDRAFLPADVFLERHASTSYLGVQVISEQATALGPSGRMTLSSASASRVRRTNPSVSSRSQARAVVDDRWPACRRKPVTAASTSLRYSPSSNTGQRSASRLMTAASETAF